MGWLFSCDSSHGKKELVQQLRGPSRFGENKLIRATTVGNHHWYLLQIPDGRKIIGLDLMQGGGRNQGWGYKDMDETCGPYHHDCPLVYLTEASAPENEYSREWRERVMQYHAAKRERPEYAPKQVWKYGDHLYMLVDKCYGKRGWQVYQVHPGKDGTYLRGAYYRMKYRQLAAATYLHAGEYANA